MSEVPRVPVVRAGDAVLAVLVSGQSALWCADALADVMAELRRRHIQPEPLAVALERALRDVGRTPSTNGKTRDERAPVGACSSRWVDAEQAGRLLGRSGRRVRQLAQLGELVPIRSKPHYLFDAEVVLAYKERSQ